MKLAVRKTLFAVLAILLVLDFYSIFNAGNPNSLFRVIIPDPSWDVAITVILSLAIALISIAMMQESNRNSIRNILESNRDHIMRLRAEGKSDPEIADSFIEELPVRREFLRNMIRRRVLKNLKRMHS